MQDALKEGDRDLDERLAVMATGLSGEYCWAVVLGLSGSSARIEAAVTPASPSLEELARAVEANRLLQAAQEDY
jgi:hypothetical protein